MTVVAARTVSLTTLLKLGRVSNVPTVWTNVLAGTLLAGGGWQSWRTGLIVLAMTLFYVGGMYLNDFCDRAIDARERPERPIPAQEISPRTVAAIGFGLLGGGIVLMAPLGVAAFTSALLLAAAIVAYDFFHKGHPWSPLIMGLCRALVYVGAGAAAVGDISRTSLLSALALLAFVAGVTYAAWQERLDRPRNLWPLALLAPPLLLAWPALEQGVAGSGIYLALVSAIACALYLLAMRPVAGAVPHAVGLLIAAISLVDAAFLASIDAVAPSLIAVLGFALTLTLQRYIMGT
jgi:4-hydroxybenzoate polyprenyltransferase